MWLRTFFSDKLLCPCCCNDFLDAGSILKTKCGQQGVFSTFFLCLLLQSPYLFGNGTAQDCDFEEDVRHT